MAFSYNNSLAHLKDVVRLNLGDTVPEAAYLSDEEIVAILNLESGNTDKATIRLAKGLAARFAREMSVRKTGREDEAGLYEDAIQRAKFFRDLAADFEKRLKENAGLDGIGFSSGSGGSSSGDGEAAFTRNLHKVNQ